MEPHLPSVLGARYRLGDLLGGTASRVHRAHDVLLQRDVAIKSFPGDDGPQRWRRDAHLRRLLGAAQAIDVLDGAPDGDGGPFVVMPLLGGGSLDRVARPWDISQVAALVERLAPGLGHLHRSGDVHGAVAADAVLLDAEHGARWAGHGTAPAPGATAHDDVLALARLATSFVTGLPQDVADPSAEVVDAVGALVERGAQDGVRARVRAGLAADAARRGVPVALPADPGRRARRAPVAVVAACACAVVLGGFVGLGAGVVGHASATVVSGEAASPVRAPLAVAGPSPAAAGGLAARLPGATAPAPREDVAEASGPVGSSGSVERPGDRSGRHTTGDGGSGTARGRAAGPDRGSETDSQGDRDHGRGDGDRSDEDPGRGAGSGHRSGRGSGSGADSSHSPDHSPDQGSDHGPDQGSDQGADQGSGSRGGDDAGSGSSVGDLVGDALSA